jgi:hypothetical protein
MKCKDVYEFLSLHINRRRCWTTLHQKQVTKEKRKVDYIRIRPGAQKKQRLLTVALVIGFK